MTPRQFAAKFPGACPGVGGRPRTLAAGWLAGKVMGAVRGYCASQDPEIGRRHFEHIDGLDLPDDQGNRTYDNNDAVAAYLLPFARRAWTDLTGERGSLRFTHDVYLKMFSPADPVLPGDFILFDEAQDADPVQELIVRNQVRHGKQVVVVGDEMQVLYEWRGAINALANFEAAGTQVAFLTQSFRFGDAVAEVANGLLSRLSARLQVRGFGPVASTVGPCGEPNAVLCRTNAGAVRNVLAAIDRGQRPHLVGNASDIIKFCRAARRLPLGQHCDHPELGIFDSWAAVQAYVADGDEGADLKLMVNLVDEFGADTIIRALEHQPARGVDPVLCEEVRVTYPEITNVKRVGRPVCGFQMTEREHKGWDRNRLRVQALGEVSRYSTGSSPVHSDPRGADGRRATGKQRHAAIVANTAGGIKAVLRRLRPDDAVIVKTYDDEIEMLEHQIRQVRAKRAEAVRQAFGRAHVVRLNELDPVEGH